MQRGTDAGFTVLELLVALAVLVLVIGLAAARWSGGGHALGLETEARKLASALRIARGSAIRANTPRDVMFDAAGRSYRLAGEAVVRLSRAERVTAPPIIRFLPDGSSSGGRIVLAHADTSVRVDVDWITGRVTVRGDGR
jgi:general secretion pathway protein H